MGSGKTSVGNALTEILPHNFIDLDSAIENNCKLSVSEIFKTKGEIFFRKTEAEVLNTIINGPEPIVLATGGGTPCYGTVMTELINNKNCRTIYLKATLETLTERLWEEREKRPLISHIESKVGLNDFIRKHLFERGYYYNQAKTKIDTDALSPKEIAQKIVANLF